MSTRCPCHLPQLVAFAKAAIFAICYRFTVEFIGLPMILLTVMGVIMAKMASQTMASLVDGDDIVLVNPWRHSIGGNAAKLVLFTVG
jgi:hypothetical protein